jgi:hypothetical protein
VKLDLPAYTGPETLCPKCKAKRVTTMYHPCPAYPTEASRGEQWGCWKIQVPLHRVSEHLCRECVNCGFTWAEALADEAEPGAARLTALPGGASP